MTTNEIRSKFLNFFKSKGHEAVVSDSLVPKDDSTVLFTTAGMQQFKPQFLGRDVTYKRATTCQKCLRTDDLDCVGQTDFHHTFFEMLGNFSFGDYFKKDAIHWALEFLTQELKLPKEKLWVSVYKEDDEAYGIWLNEIRVPQDRIVKLGDKSNFWPSNARFNGPNGPCGPCSEIFYDYGVNPKCPKGKDCDPDCSCGRFSEIWNLVFTQFNRKDGGVLDPLPGKNIDTGMGLERLAAVVQGKKSNYETDAFAPIINEIKKAIPAITQKDARIIGDHLRAVTIGITDGVVPSNEGRGYVIRKLIVDMTDLSIRAGVAQPVIHTFINVVAQTLGLAYPDVVAKAEEIKVLVKRIEEAFIKVRKDRVPELKDRLEAAQNDPQKIGEILFLYRDTHGLTPSTLMSVGANDAGIPAGILNQGFKIYEQLMEEQKNRSRAGSKMLGDVFADSGLKLDVAKTEFVGYKHTTAQATVLKVIREGSSVKVILNRTPFYAQSGGQIGDAGDIGSTNGVLRVTDTQKINDIYVHEGTLEGVLKEGDQVTTQVDEKQRLAIMRNHTATHLLQAALRNVLGGHIKQQGSLVAAERLRFDFTHPGGVKPDEIKRIEDQINAYIQKADPVVTDVLPIEEAKKRGALAFFAEKYGQTVRVISIDSYSKEFCGGTHVSSTGEIEEFRITSEGSVAQGIRRIEAVTGKVAIEAFKREVQKEDALKEQALKLRQQDKEKQSLRFDAMKALIGGLIQNAEKINNIDVIIHGFKDADMDMLRKFSDLLKQKTKNSILILGSANQADAVLVIAVTDDLIARGVKANDLLKEIAPLIGGTGGGRPQLAQAGGKEPQKVGPALEQAREIVKANIKI